MDSFVFTAVLFAAFAHAGWNAAAKRGLDPLVTTVLMAICAGLIGLALIPLVGLPAWPAWPWVIASALIHVVYFGALIEGYAAGDMGVVYPIARGAAPLMTAAATATLVAERIGLFGWLGVGLLAAGVGVLSLRRGAAQLVRRAVGFALLTAVTICVYTLVDGIGARRAGSAHAYTASIFFGIGIAMASYAFVRRGPRVFALMAREWRPGLSGGALQIGSYGIAIWAMTVAPIALVAALRETSVLFGAILAVALLKEPLLASRVAAALMIVCGLVMIRLA
ncbi:MAG: EamA family transporter [Xanthobacteraceae bacterium]